MVSWLEATPTRATLHYRLGRRGAPELAFYEVVKFVIRFQVRYSTAI